MNLLIVSATEMEIRPLRLRLQGVEQKVEFLVTGVGIHATTYALTKHLQTNTYDLVLQAGVCGSFNSVYPPKSLVFITADQFGDLGAEDHDEFIDLFEMGLLQKNTFPYTLGRLENPFFAIYNQINLPQVIGLTVNTVSGSEPTIKRRTEKYAADVESMEGAAFHFVCVQENVAFAQVRAVSNEVTPRNKSAWKMKEAIIALNSWLEEFIRKE